ncbi:uncharacterized protein LOC108036346 [Drosophila biarmipes]|uniref:uncharacterized protein LOC108036346 n=1 Tax=Drosophila biarmipes TaxID=125945 RepID=UPI0007E8B1D0|nr:uncharacterized protein LOC108036346 [Drosophila biarmipes]
MPICKNLPGTASKKTATDISADHVTEAAQVKRTREQAYFNSYDFDAIEVLPYDEEDDEAGDTSQGRSRSHSRSRSQSRNGSSSSRSSSTRRYTASKDPGATNKFAYLQRLGAFFARNGGGAGASGAGAEEAASGAAPSGGGATKSTPKGSSENFLLPRAMLKYQSSATTATSASPTSTATAIPSSTSTASAPMPLKNGHGLGSGMGNAIGHDQQLEVTTSAGVGERGKKCSIASNVSSTHSSDSGLPLAAAATAAATTSATATSATAATSAAAAAATQSTETGGSHYSTDKSGSSGYYSSNVCSTYSLDEHIYCEPVIDVQEKIKSVAARQRQRPPLQLPTKVAAPQEVALASADPPLASAEKLSAVNSQRLDMQDAAGAAASNDHHPSQSKADVAEGLHHYSSKLRILETSIENLDRHLKTFPSLYAQEHIVSFMQATGVRNDVPSHPMDIGEKLRVYNQLPTIMEQQQMQQQQEQLADDSLMDIDLDAFLLAPNVGPHRGIDNPSFLNDEQLAENNYKCAKYINSCPEDAYRLESEKGASGGGVAEETYAKRYEDQLHFQNTRELLEDVRDKIRLLSRATPPASSAATPTPASTPPTDVPKELEGMIHTLKHELESYLQRMNQHSELELRQLCSGLGRQQHVVRLQNALERRRSCADLQLNAYEAVRDGVLISASGRPLSVREQIMTIRCASDPNFKMKRKSLAEIFPAAECYVESEVTTTSLSRSATPSPASTPQLELEALHPGHLSTTVITQMQRNLTFHKPILAVASGSQGIGGSGAIDGAGGDKAQRERERERESIAEWHRKKPSIWEMYYGTNRLHQSLLGKQRSGGELVISSAQPTLSYPSSRPESDFTLDLPRAEQLRLKMEKEKKFRQRCRFITTFLSLVFFLLTVMVVSLVLTRGKRMFGSMI